MELRKVQIADRIIGHDHRCFIIAEVGVNHNGNLELAQKLINIAQEAGADAVKFQTFKVDHFITREAPMADYQIQNTGSRETQYEMLKRLELSPKAHRELIHECHKKKILFLSTPFDEESADLLDHLGVAAFKIASGEITNIPFLSYVAKKKKPMIVSTGMADLSEVRRAVDVIRKAGTEKLILLHCVSNYPANPTDINLRAMKTMEESFNVPVGYSDHTLGNEIAFAAVALGASTIEKHFTLDRNLPGPDHRASLTPEELLSLVQGIRKIETSLGDGRKVPTPNEQKTALSARKSLVAARNIPAGTTLREELIAIKRPGTGLAPILREQIVGKKLCVDITVGTLFSWDMLI